MPVEKKKTINYYSINEGDIRSTSGGDKGETYKTIWGILVGIDLKKDSYEGETIYKYYFKFEDPDHEQLEILQVGEAASAARGIIMSLFSIPGPINMVKIKPYTKKADDGKTYTNVWVEYAEGTHQQWNDTKWSEDVIENLPQVEMVKVGDKEMKDDWNRRKYIRMLAKRIKDTKLNVRSGEYVDEKTGEVFDGQQAASDAYSVPQPSKPAPEKVTPHPVEINGLDEEEQYQSVFEDVDDDLPF